MLRIPAVLLLMACTAVSACQPKNEIPPDGLSIDEARALCLEKPGGGLPLDDEIRLHQDRARLMPIKPDEWVFVGRGWVRKARLSGDPGFYVNVQGCVDMALNVDPRSTDALGLRGLALMNDHKFEAALVVSQQILAADPKDIIALGTLSDALLELGRFEDAAAAAQRLINVKPNMGSYSRASYLRWLQGDTDGAKLLIRQALKARDSRDPEPAAWTFVQAGTIFWQEGDYDGADAVFMEALKWVPDYPPALTGRARVALSVNAPARAVEYLEKAYRITPLVELAWLLGDAREMLGDTEGARAQYEKVMKEGRSRDPMTLASFNATKNRSPEETVRLIEAERAVRGGVYVDDVYAWALYRAGRIDEARAAIDRATRLGTKDARLLYHAGAIRLAAGDTTGRDLIRKALALNPRFDGTGAVEAARLLDNTGAVASAP